MIEYPVRIVQIRSRNLPHWTTDEGTYAVTFRLADALSSELARRIAERRRSRGLAERLLDRNFGRCWLRHYRIALLVDGAIRFFDQERYLMHAWTIMPNHVHAAFRLLPGVKLDEVTKAWKGYTARRANEILGRKGMFWQDESYDSLLHDQHELNRVIHYIVQNPIRAKLTNWPWTTVLRREFQLRTSPVVVAV